MKVYLVIPTDLTTVSTAGPVYGIFSSLEKALEEYVKHDTATHAIMDVELDTLLPTFKAQS